MTPHALPDARLARRLAALFYDTLPLTGLAALVAFIDVNVRGGAAAPGDPLFRLMLIAITGVFFVGFWVRAGQTVGMRAWRLRVERVDGSSLNVGVATARYFAALFSVAAFGLGFLWSLVDREHRTWHDRLTGTRIVLLPHPDR